MGHLGNATGQTCSSVKTQPCSATDAFYLPNLKEALSCENVSLAIPDSDTLEGAEAPMMEIPSFCSVSHHVLTPSHNTPGHQAEVNDVVPLLLRCGVVLWCFAASGGVSVVLNLSLHSHNSRSHPLSFVLPLRVQGLGKERVPADSASSFVWDTNEILLLA